ncbi:MAG: hypothetical protein JXR37_27875 [Kiritimatiellae bacterium]|nr:hypothetical protein [Kiritimatiellia bacterium]
MTGKERVLAAFEFREADRVPRCWGAFWPEFRAEWDRRFPGRELMRHFGNDLDVVAADETPWPTRAGVVRESGGDRIVRDGWGQVTRSRPGAPIGQVLEVGVPDRIDPDKLAFDDPLQDSRYAGEPDPALREELFLFCKTGGPYKRSSFLRGEEQLWLDLMDDPGWARAFVERVTDHLIAVGVESIRRWGMQETGIEINDDVASNRGPFVGPETYARVFLPPLRRMVRAYKEAGARFVMHHADGNVLALLDMWIEAGVDVVNPVEYRAGMDAVAIRARYGNRLALVGGLDNCGILPRGDRAEVRDHVLHLLEAGRGGGFVFGPHSIGSDISVDTLLDVLEWLETHGRYPMRPRVDG